jgi:hypothetical protein
MARNPQTFVWLAAACAALFAQVVPQSLCGACDRGCCRAENRDRGPAADDLDGLRSSPEASTDGCPLCAAASEECRSDTTEQPCRCQLESRQDQPLTASPSPPDRDPSPQVAVLETASQHASHTLGLSREYAATSLAIPIRPTRILYGVWRN